jgi:16S rRNA (uracil1498-N3)-methyltransferase
MHRHHIETARLAAPSIELARAEARHLQTVLRVRAGEIVELFDGRGLTVRCRAAAADRHGLRLEPLAPPVRHPPTACRITLFACVCKGPRMDWTVEKAVELGAAAIVPVLAERSVVRLDASDAAERVTRWQRVAAEAGRQCGAAWLPEIAAPCDLPAACGRLAACAPVFVAALTPEARRLRAVLAERRAAAAGTPAAAGWFVGPEGDFTPDELRQVAAAGAIPVSLGGRVLRAETAALWGLCVLGAEWLD